MKDIKAKASEYMQFMQKKLKEKGVKSPFNLKPDERKNFFKKLKEEWKKKSAAVSPMLFERFDDSSLKEVANALEYTGNKMKYLNKNLFLKVKKYLNKELKERNMPDKSEKKEEISEE